MSETHIRVSGARRHETLGSADWLCLVATPTFAIMALITDVLGGGQYGHDVLEHAGWLAVERHGPDVPADERLPRGALAEADLQPTPAYSPVLMCGWKRLCLEPGDRPTRGTASLAWNASAYFAGPDGSLPS